MQRNLLLLLIAFAFHVSLAQAPLKGMTMEEYTLAKTFDIKDLDNDNYAKFGENKYIAERYDDKKPYFVTGDDGMKKRIDLYQLSRKGENFPIGTLIYYTTETGKRYINCTPNNLSDGKVWEQYFSDIHATDKVEKFYVLKLSYILSKEFSYQMYKTTLKGGAVNRAESGTYGNDICFPGTDLVTMADGSKRMLQDVHEGDRVVTVDPVSTIPRVTVVNKMMAHKAGNYAITTLTLLGASCSADKHDIHLSIREIKATPNHPLNTIHGIENIGSLKPGEQIECMSPFSNKPQNFIVWDKSEEAGGWQQVYNLETSDGNTYIVNGVIVRQK